jgi:hypothetical protein
MGTEVNKNRTSFTGLEPSSELGVCLFYSVRYGKEEWPAQCDIRRKVGEGKVEFGNHGGEIFDIFSEAPKEREGAFEAGGFAGTVDRSDVGGYEEVIYCVRCEGDVWEYFGPGEGKGVSG